MSLSFLNKVKKVKIKNIPFRFNHHEFYKLIGRLTNKLYIDKIVLKTISSSSGFDEYSLFDDNNKIVIEATSGIAAGVALNYYLSKCCKVHFGIITDSGDLPEIPPKVGEIVKRKSLYHYRYFLNYCTFGYSLSLYTWKEWERLIDRMILSGYNLVLNTVGQESVWRELLLSLNYTDKEISSFLVGASFMPWFNMMNISSYYGEYPPYWYDQRIYLSNRITSRLFAFGASVMVPSYSGMVPSDFDKKYPDCKLKSQGKWCGFDRPKIISYDDPYFEMVSDRFYQIQNRLITKNRAHYYSVDPFHEGGNSDGIDMKQYAFSIFSSMKKIDRKAVWCFQGWDSNPSRELLTGIPVEDTLICNLLADTNDNAGDNFSDRPWIYCSVNNFGGQHVLRGGLKNSLLKPYKFINDNYYTMVGIGLMPESLDCDEVFFDILSYTSVNNEKPIIEDYLTYFITNRYGYCNESLQKAWHILANDIYLKDDITVCFESPYLAMPSLDATKVSRFSKGAKDNYPDKLIRVTKLLLENYDLCKDSSSYIFDLADIARQTSANYSWHLVYSMKNDYLEKNYKSFENNSKLFLKLMSLQDKICSCHSKMLFGKYLAYTKNVCKSDSLLFNIQLRRLITLWGDKKSSYVLNDYGAREYGGLIRDYYLARWKIYLNMVSESLLNNKPMNEHDFYHDSESFINESKPYTLTTRKDLNSLVSNLIEILTINSY